MFSITHKIITMHPCTTLYIRWRSLILLVYLVFFLCLPLSSSFQPLVIRFLLPHFLVPSISLTLNPNLSHSLSLPSFFSLTFPPFPFSFLISLSPSPFLSLHLSFPSTTRRVYPVPMPTSRPPVTSPATSGATPCSRVCCTNVSFCNCGVVSCEWEAY